MYKNQQMDRGIRILGGSVLLALVLIGGDIDTAGKTAAILVGIYGLLTGIINYCPLTVFILKEKKIKRKQNTTDKPVTTDDVKSLYFFQGFDTNEIKIILSKCRLKQYLNDFQIIQEGTLNKIFSIIYSGTFKIVKKISDTETKIIGTMSDGEPFGERAFFNHLPPTVSVYSMGDAKVLEIDEADFNDLIGGNPVLGIKILRRLLEISSLRMSALDDQIASIGNMVVQIRQHGKESHG